MFKAKAALLAILEGQNKENQKSWITKVQVTQLADMLPCPEKKL